MDNNQTLDLGFSSGVNRIKVLAVSYLFPNSLQPNHGIFVLNRLKALSHYVDITVINPIPWFPLNGFFSRYQHVKDVPKLEEIKGLKVYHPRYFSVPGIMKGIEAGSYKAAVLETVKEIKADFDLIDLHWTYPDLPAGEQLKSNHKKPLLCTLRGMEAFYRGQGKARSDYIDRGLKNADRLIALSDELKSTADVITKVPEKSVVITNGVDTDSFKYIPQENARKEISLPVDCSLKIILGVGSLIHRKGFDLVIDALPKLKQKYPDIKYYILGSEGPEGDYRAELKSKVRDLQLEDTVIFQGAVPNSELASWYSACDVFCLSSRGEGSPNVLSEALACGCPSVSSNVGASSDIMAMAGLSQFVLNDINDGLEMRQLLHQALSFQVQRSKLSAHYRQYNWDWCAKKVFGIYQELVS